MKILDKIVIRLKDGIGNVSFVRVTPDGVRAYTSGDMGSALSNHVRSGFFCETVRNALQQAMPKGKESVLAVAQHYFYGVAAIERVWETEGSDEPFAFLQGIKQKLYLSKIGSDGAVKQIVRSELSKKDLAEFIVDAMNRGWISNFNMGIDEDGKVI
jgi:predicted cupin superfamily sugar epimerase